MSYTYLFLFSHFIYINEISELQESGPFRV